MHHFTEALIQKFYLMSLWGNDLHWQEQMAYNANKLSSIVRKRDTAQNWLVYFQLKHLRNPKIRPTIKVFPDAPYSLHFITLWSLLTSACFLCYCSNLSAHFSVQTGFCGLFGAPVDALDYYKAQIEQLTKEVRYLSCYFQMNLMLF